MLTSLGPGCTRDSRRTRKTASTSTRARAAPGQPRGRPSPAPHLCRRQVHGRHGGRGYPGDADDPVCSRAGLAPCWSWGRRESVSTIRYFLKLFCLAVNIRGASALPLADIRGAVAAQHARLLVSEEQRAQFRPDTVLEDGKCHIDGLACSIGWSFVPTSK